MSTKFTTKGSITLWRDGLKISQHTVAEEAYERAFSHADTAGPGKYVVKYPDREIDVQIRVVRDVTAPSVPANLIAAPISQTRIDLSWNASTDDWGVAKYRIYRVGQALPIGESTTLTFSNTGLTGSTQYQYRVSAVDTAGNESAQSAQAQATTPDQTAPSVPTGLAAQVLGNTSIRLTWNASTDTGGAGVQGYRVYRNGSQVGTPTSTTFDDTGLTPSTLYQYRVSAVDNATNESGQSSPAVSATTSGGATLAWQTTIPTQTAPPYQNVPYSLDLDTLCTAAAGFALAPGSAALPTGTSLVGATGVISGTPTVLQTVSPTIFAYDGGAWAAEQDYLARANAAGVLRAGRFISQAEVDAWKFPDAQQSHITWLQGDGPSNLTCARIAVLNNDGTNNGALVNYIAPDQRIFGAGQASKQYYFQFRQKGPAAWIYNTFPGNGANAPFGDGLKHCILSWHAASNPGNAVVIEDEFNLGYPTWYYYNGSYINDAIFVPAANAYRRQTAVDNGGPATTLAECRLRYGGMLPASGGKNTGTPTLPQGGFYYLPDEWMTFEIRVDFTNGFGATRIEIWCAHENQAPVKIASTVVSIGSTNGGHDATWLLPYCTGRTSNGGFDTYTLYGEPISSVSPIRFPGDFPITPG